MNIRREMAVGTAVLGAALGMSLLLAPSADRSPATRFSWLRSDPQMDSVEFQRRVLTDSVRAARQTWERLDSYERARGLTASGVGLRIVVDRDVPDSLARAFTQRVRDELRTIAPEPAHAVVVRVTLDHELGSRFRLATVLPQEASGPCVVLIRASANAESYRMPRRNSQLLGVCGLYARFGAPGGGMAQWLVRTEQEAASTHTFDGGRPEQRMGLQASYLPAGAPLLSCLGGATQACEEIFARGYSGWGYFLPNIGGIERARAVPVPGVAVTSEWLFGAFGGEGRTGLAGLRHSLGDARFRRIWTSRDEPAVAFRASEGVPLGVWVRDQLLVDFSPYQAGGMPSGVRLWLALLLTAGFALAGVRLGRRAYEG